MSTLNIDPGPIVVAGSNPVFWAFTCANLGSGTYTARVAINAGALPTYTMEYPLDVNRYFEVDISRILGGACPLVPLYTIAARGAKYFYSTHFVNYSIEVKFYKNGVLQSGETRYYDRKAIRAGNDIFGTLGPLWDNLLNDRYLSVLPAQREVAWSDWITIPVFIDTAVDDGEAQVVFAFYAPNGDLIDAVSRRVYTITSTQQNIFHYINTLNGVVAESGLVIDKDAVGRVVVHIENEAGDYYTGGATLAFKIIPEDSLFPRRSFLFFNSVGGYDTVQFTGKKIPRLAIQKQRAQVYKKINSPGITEVKEYNIQRLQPMSINSGYQKSAVFYAFQDLLASEDVYEMVDGVAIPVEIKPDTFVMDEDNENNKAVQMDYSYKLQNFGISRLLKV